jgi:hypothetical protein
MLPTQLIYIRINSLYLNYTFEKSFSLYPYAYYKHFQITDLSFSSIKNLTCQNGF